MHRARWFRLLAALFAFTLIAAACGNDDDEVVEDEPPTDDAAPPADAPEGDPVLIGALLPESGALSAIVDSLRVPIDLAVEEANQAGGVLGRPVQVVGADDGTDDTTIASASLDRLLTSDGIHVLIGPASSDLSEALMADIAGADVVACSGSNTSAGLEELNDNDRYFGFAPNDNLQGPALAEVINNDGHDSVAILVRNDTYGVGFGNAVEGGLQDVGVDVVFNEAYDPEADSFTAEVERLAQSGADAVVVIGFSTDGGQVISDMIERGIGPGDYPIYTGDGMQGSAFWEAVGAEPSVVEGIKGTAPAAAPEGVEHPFQERFAETGVDTIFSAYKYDCAVTLLLAIEAAGTTDTDAVIAAMQEVTSGDNECRGFAECRDLLADGQSIDVQGASGDLALNEGGHVTSGAYDIWEYDAEGAPVTLDEPQIVLSLEQT